MHTCIELQVSFHKRATNYRALLRKMTYEDKARHFLACSMFLTDSLHISFSFSLLFFFSLFFPSLPLSSLSPAHSYPTPPKFLIKSLEDLKTRQIHTPTYCNIILCSLHPVQSYPYSTPPYQSIYEDSRNSENPTHTMQNTATYCICFLLNWNTLRKTATFF